jgi:hypothetical protein
LATHPARDGRCIHTAAPALGPFLRQAGAVISSPIYPQSSQPRPGSNSSGGYRRDGHSPGAPNRRRKHPCSPRGPSLIGRDAHPATAPCPGHVGPAPTQQLNRTKLETLHKHLETKPKITDHHQRTHKTSKGLILLREIHHTLTNIRGLGEGDRRHQEEKSKLKHLLGIEHGNIPIQLDLWGNEVIFRGKGQTTL